MSLIIRNLLFTNTGHRILIVVNYILMFAFSVLCRTRHVHAPQLKILEAIMIGFRTPDLRVHKMFVIPLSRKAVLIMCTCI